jgi:hypothetical protein
MTRKTMLAMAHSVHVGQKPVDHSMEMYCLLCGTILFRVPAGYSNITKQVTGKCDCNWGCCVGAMPQNRDHEKHLAWRKSSVEVVEWTRLKK